MRDDKQAAVLEDILHPKEPVVAAPVRSSALVEDTSTLATSTPNRVDTTDELREKVSLYENSSVLDNIEKSFTSGDNWGYQLWRGAERAYEGGAPDPMWTHEKALHWIESKGDAIAPDQRWRYLSTNNEDHANLLLQDGITSRENQRQLALTGGFSAGAAPFITGIVDLDTPFTFGAGALAKSGLKAGLMATKTARLLSTTSRMGRGAIAGGGALGAAAGLSYLSDPNGNPQDIFVASLAGMVFGGISPGGKLKVEEDAINKHTGTVLDELDENIKDGMPGIAPEKIPTSDDSFGFVAARAKEVQDYEAAKAAPAVEGVEKVEPRMPFSMELDKISSHPDTVKFEDAGPQGSSVGSQQSTMHRDGTGIDTIKSTRTVDIITQAEQFVGRNGLDNKWWSDLPEMEAKYGKAGKLASRLRDAMNTPFNGAMQSNFEKFFNSGSAVAQQFAYKALTNGAGIIRNSTAADAIMRYYHLQIMAKVMPYDHAYKEFLGTHHKDVNVIERVWRDAELRDQYHREVVAEIQGRFFDPPGTVRTVPDYVKKAADAHDEFYKYDVEIGQGLPGQTHRYGYDQLVQQVGYMPQKLLGRKLEAKLSELTKSLGDGKKALRKVERAIAKAIQQSNGLHINAKDALIWSQAMVNHARMTDAGVSTNLIGLLKEDGADKLASVLVANGVTPQAAESLIKKLVGDSKEAGKAGHLKERADIDLRSEIDGISMMDLFDTNLAYQYGTRGRQAAGMSALARIGITSRADIKEIKEAIKLEMQRKGKEIRQTTWKDKVAHVEEMLDAQKQISDEDIDAIFSHFTGESIAGGLSPAYSRIRKYTNLALLNQLGVTQMAEFGPLIGAMGWRKFWSQLPGEIKAAITDKNSPLVQEMQHIGFMIPEQRLFREDRQFELEKTRLGEGKQLMDHIDQLTNAAQQLQGHTSGFFLMRSIQQRMAMTQGVSRLFESLNGKLVSGVPISPERLADMGFSPADIVALQRKVAGAEFDPDTGKLIRTRIDTWTPQEQQDFVIKMQGVVDKYVHYALAGESNVLFHKDGLTSLFFQLKNFPLTAFAKQAYRNAKIGDSEAGMTFLFGLTTAGMAYMAKQAINGKTENLTPEKIAKGAFGYSNFTGWFPMWSDPIAGLMGLDALKFNSSFRQGDGIIAMPAGYSVLQKWSELPGIPADILTGNMSNGTLRNLQAFPIIGNAYGVPLALSMLKDDGGAKPKEKPKPRMTEQELKDYRASSSVPGFLQPDDETLQGFFASGDIKKAKPPKKMKRMTDKELADYKASSSVPGFLQPDDETLQQFYGTGQIKK